MERFINYTCKCGCEISILVTHDEVQVATYPLRTVEPMQLRHVEDVDLPNPLQLSSELHNDAVRRI